MNLINMTIIIFLILLIFSVILIFTKDIVYEKFIALPTIKKYIPKDHKVLFFDYDYVITQYKNGIYVWEYPELLIVYIKMYKKFTDTPIIISKKKNYLVVFTSKQEYRINKVLDILKENYGT